jgi:hypothetical protein
LDENEVRVEQARLDLERERFEWEKSQASGRGIRTLLTPTGVVLVGAALGLIGTALGKYADYMNSKRQQETNVILKASDVQGDPAKVKEQRANNLLWFTGAGYIDLPTEFTDQLRKDAHLAEGEIPATPVIGTVPPYYSCRSDAECRKGYLCIDNNGDKQFYCKPTCSSDADCAGDPYRAIKCKQLGRNGNPNAQCKLFCMGDHDVNEAPQGYCTPSAK